MRLISIFLCMVMCLVLLIVNANALIEIENDKKEIKRLNEKIELEESIIRKLKQKQPPKRLATVKPVICMDNS